MWKNRLLIRALPIAILTFPLVSLSAIAQNSFGETGQDGARGRDGRSKLSFYFFVAKA